MLINITLEAGGRVYEIRADNRQRISAVLEVLKHRGLYDGETRVALFRSKMRGELVNGDGTFEEASVWSGDFLSALRRKGTEDGS
jgi:hypothetical protein